MAAAAIVLFCAAACSERAEPPPHVVVFTALDRVYSEPIFRRFEADTGIVVRPVYDAEAAKTTGLINRLIARRGNPECDVLWNNEPVQTQVLADMGLLEAYQSPGASRIPFEFRDPQHRWTGFAARMRVIIYNRRLISSADLPSRLADFLDPRWRGRAAIASPFYGTTFTHIALLHQQWGDRPLEQWLRGLKDNAVIVAPGNGPVRDLVAAGECAFGLTDTDDAHGAIIDGKPVGVVAVDGQALLIPNTVALLAGAPRPGEGRRLIDYLLSAEVERALATGRSAQIPLGRDLAGTPTPWDELRSSAEFVIADVRGAAAARQPVIKLLRSVELDR